MALLVKPTKVGDVTVDKALRELRGALSSKVDTPLLLMWGALDAGSATTDDCRLWPGFSPTGASNTATPPSIPVFRGGRLRNMVLSLGKAGSAAVDVTYLVQVNGKDTPLQLTVADTRAGVFFAADREVSVKAGDSLTLVVRKSALSSSATYPVVTLELV